MRRLLFVVLAFLAVAAHAAPDERLAGLDIRVEEGGWGNTPVAAIERTLYAVADVLLPHLPARLRAAPIRVTHADGPPVTLYERGPAGEYLVHLHASGPRWHLYVYEFAHELTHIVSNYDLHAAPGKRRDNQWLEESLCETASLFALDRLAAAWARLPETEELAPRAAALRRFYDTLVDEPHRRLPAGYSFAAWIADNEPQLRGDPYQRQKDDLVARRLLPLFQRDPDGWSALHYLNLDAADNEATLAQYLSHWYGNAPALQKPFVGAIVEVLAGNRHSF